MSEIITELKKIPPVTRFMLGSVAVVTLPILLQLTPGYWVGMHWPSVLKLQVWRLWSSFFYGGGGLPLIFDFAMLYRNSNDLELNHYRRRTADYAFSLISTAGLILALNYPFRTAIFFRPFLLAVTYLWAQRNTGLNVSLFGLISMPALAYPFALIGLELIMHGPRAALIATTGVIAAHVWNFLDVVYPASQGGRRLPLVRTPEWLKRWLPDGGDPTGPSRGAAGQPQGRRVDTSFGTVYRPNSTIRTGSSGAGSSSSGTTTAHQWGSGRRLG